MTAVHLSPVHAMPTGLCEDASGEASALIGRISRGDALALEELCGIWAPVFLGICQRMLGEPKDAAKTVRETFVRIWQGAGDYDPHQSPPFVWAFTILRDLCIERLRRRGGGKSPSRARAGSPRPELPEDPRIMPSDDWRRLRNALATLSPDELECLETAVFLGFARSAAPSESPPASVKTSLRRALDIIRTRLSRYEL